jgi:hypothetical protein
MKEEIVFFGLLGILIIVVATAGCTYGYFNR